jgi:chemotaxis protein methyltransferase CheR
MSAGALAELLGRRLGLAVEPSRAQQLLELRSRALGVPRHLYVPRIDTLELEALFAELSVSESYVLRDAAQLRAFTDVALPNTASSHVRILSAGCAGGEEAYTLALLFADADGERTADVLGVDLSADAIAKAQRARFSEWALRATPPNLRARWFTADGAPLLSARTRVHFRRANLLEGFPPASFDIVFCRNTLMYFLPDQMRHVLEGLARALVPGGYLFLGHAESTRGITDAFTLCHSHDTFYYRREGAASPRTTWFETIGSASDRIAGLAEAARVQVQQTKPPAECVADAVLALDVGDFVASEALCRLALASASPAISAEAHYLIAISRDGQRDHDAAVELYRTAAALDPQFAMPRLRHGMLARRRGDKSTAHRELSSAMMLLAEEREERVDRFGGGFSRALLIELCRTELEGA